VLGSGDSALYDSFADGLLEYPQYTRPPEFRGEKVPDVLLSGNHAEIAKWRRKESIKRTLASRPELLEGIEWSKADKKLLAEIGK
jgi:tRNA (guanine37-N1)-methyltransferase